MPADLQDHRNSLARLISLSERAVTRHLQEQFLADGAAITVPQWRALYFLWIQDGRPQQDVAAYVGSNNAVMTRLIEGLEEKGLVRRTASENDGRKKLVYLTAAGRKLPDRPLPLAGRTIAAVEDGLSAKEIEACGKVLQRVMDNLGRHSGRDSSWRTDSTD